MFDSTEVCGSKSNGTEKLKKFGRLEEVLFAGYLKISFFLQVPGDVLRKTGETKEVNKKNKKKNSKNRLILKILCFPVSAERPENSDNFCPIWCFQP